MLGGANLNVYIMLFFLTLLDSTGIPAGIITNGVLFSLNEVNLIGGLLVINISMIILDFITIAFGKWVGYYYKKNSQRSSKLYKMSNKMILKGTEIMDRQTNYFYLVGKFIPCIGKVVPMFMGYKSDFNKKSFGYLFLGNLIYSVVFSIIGAILGDIFLEYSIYVSGVIFILFCLGYKLLVRKFEK